MSPKECAYWRNTCCPAASLPRATNTRARHRTISVSRKSSEAIDKAAGDWLARRESGTWSAADQVDFDHWLEASTFHRVAYLRLEHAWEEGLRLKALGAGVPTDRVPPPGHVLSRYFDPSQEPCGSTRDALPRHRSWLGWAAAATV